MLVGTELILFVDKQDDLEIYSKPYWQLMDGS